MFHALANLPSDVQGISKCLNNRKIGVTNQPTVNRAKHNPTTSPTTESRPFNVEPLKKALDTTYEEDSANNENKSDIEESMEGSHPAQPAEPGTLKASLLDTPAIGVMTEPESAHPLQAPLCDFSPMNEHCDSTNIQEIQSEEISKLSLNEHDAESPLKRTVTQVRMTSFVDKFFITDCVSIEQRGSIRVSSNPVNNASIWTPSPEWVASWRAKLPLQTIMRLLQVLVPQVEKICIDKYVIGTHFAMVKHFLTFSD